jgi:hypothetical protein
MFKVLGEEFLAPGTSPILVDHPLASVRDCLFNILAATLDIWRLFLHPQSEDAPYGGDREFDMYKVLDL